MHPTDSALLINSSCQTAQQGRHRSAGSNSISGLLSTLIPVLIVSVVLFGVFLLLRRSQRRLYAPRTYLGTLRDQLVVLLLLTSCKTLT